MSINLFFREKNKQNVIIKGKPNMPFSELINLYYKNICASKKDKLTKIFFVKGNEISPEDNRKLSELGLKDFSEVDIASTEKVVTYACPKKEELKTEPAVEKPPGEEPPENQQMKKLENTCEKVDKKEDQTKNNKIINISFEKQNEELIKIKINKLEKYIKELELKIEEEDKIINEEKIINNK